jgi:excisionase family DNA binding protein
VRIVEFETLLKLAASLPVAELPHLIGCLTEVAETARARLYRPEPSGEASPPRSGDWLTIAEAARRLHCSPSFLYRHSREFRAQHVGRALRFPARALERNPK